MTAKDSGKRPQDPTLTLMGVVRYILRATGGLSEAALDNSGNPTKQGFYVSHNPAARTVWVEALGYPGTEQLMLVRYRTTITRALSGLLGTNGYVVEVVDSGMVRISSLTDLQIASLAARYSS